MPWSSAEGFVRPFLIGLTINILLHRLGTMQVYLYFTGHKKDQLWKTTLYLADTFNCIVSIYYIFCALVIHFGDEANLLRGNWGSMRTLATAGSASTVHPCCPMTVKLFFAWRAHVLAKNVFIVATIILCSLASLAGLLGCTISLAPNPSIFRVPGLRVEVMIWLVGAVLVDTVIAASLIWHLVDIHTRFHVTFHSYTKSHALREDTEVFTLQ
ncbi:hypothetical protein EDD15DRAFT_2239256 [Pisolithus albus]|nr:hypothetical protein EDD15DRAFT_2239256 [Pisolithus albus]